MAGQSRAQGHTVPLSTVVGRRDLGLTTLVAAGDPGIGWAVASELADPAAYLRGGELLLTAGVNLPAAPAGLRGYVDSLVGAGVSALGFGVTPVHDTVPAGLVEQCRARGLPLVEVPRPTPFAAVSQAVGAELQELHLRDLRRLGEAHQALALAVTADAPVDRVLRVLADALGGWAVLARPSPAVPGGTHRTPGAPAELDPELHGLADRLTRPRGPRGAKARVRGDEVFLHTVGTPPQEHGVVLVGRPEPLDVTDRAVLRTATALLDLLARASRGAPPAPGRLITGLLLDGGLTGAAVPLLAELTAPTDAFAGPAATGASARTAAPGDPAAAGAAAAPAGAAAPGAYRVLRARPAGRGRHTAPAALPLGTRLLDAGPGEDLRAVLADRGEAAHVAHLDRLLDHGWIGALSGPVDPAELAAADRRAAALLTRARAVGGPLLEEPADPFDALLGPGGGEDLARRVLGPLAEDTDSARLLRRTLRVWLTRHGNWDRAAADLGAHRNSVRYRIGRIERDLGVDLADAEQRMRLWFALTRWRR
ncbi:PucR family transcriptional regulator [Nocardiopsis dassonvillei]|uniref:PucR family transcriptional regulator n=1 Tax=Nocardiopsis dassonvillei TaxID=2014 RepID=UPI000B9D6092|nr:PucR family transcriptional regulator [Nocardiopsis dassonvillei]ASU58746.1 PucR family transcriptional regulator [Nocardiopsis dassonvillei]